MKRKELVTLPTRNAAGHALAQLRQGGTVFIEGERGRVGLPAPVAHKIEALLAVYAEGQIPSVLAPQDDLTTQEAADILGISRPTVVKMMNEGRLPFQKPGTHRRIRRDDLMAFRASLQEERRSALAELSALGQEMDRYDRENGTFEYELLKSSKPFQER